MTEQTPAITLVEVSKRFRLAHHPVATLKGAVSSFWKRSYEDLWALKELTLDVPHGQTLAVVGKNGSGKSTLLGLLGRIYLPTSGQVTVRGRVAALLELGAGFHPDLTGEQNVLLNGVILGMREQQVRKSMDDIIEFAELEKFRDAPLRSYSAGMTMRLGFAVAVFMEPDILLIDEVLAVGDEAFQTKCLREIRRFQETGRTIIFVSHDLDTVKRVAGRAIWLHEGRVRSDGAPDHVVEEYLAYTM
ncbi:MAG: ABC transporter ATP-binding protein [Armatimonadota bacterium]